MRRVLSIALMVTLVAGIGLSAATKKYGTPLTLKETTKISDIYAKPEAFSGKRVQVKGPIVDVCAERGCWIAIGSDKEFQTLRFKVDDGVIVFPMDAKGLTAVVEGVLSVRTLSVEEQREALKSTHEAHMAGMEPAKAGEHAGMGMGKEKEKGAKESVDPKSITGPKTVIMIKGEGAEVF
jgi:hypothetical protein